MASESVTETLPALPAAPAAHLPATLEDLRGTRKAAVLMAALGAERDANVLQRMSEDEIEALSIEMAGLNSVAPETTESVFTELAELAVGLTPDDLALTRKRRLLAGHFHRLAGNSDESLAILQALVAEAAPGPERADVLFELALNYSAGAPTARAAFR